MMNVGRISTGQQYNSARDSILRNQYDFAQKTVQMNTQQRVLNNYTEYGGTRSLVSATGELAHKKQQVKNYQNASTELGLAETALTNIKDLLDTVKTDALQAANDTNSAAELKIFGTHTTRHIRKGIIKILTLNL